MKPQSAINWVEQGYIPDSIIRQGIRRLLKQRLQQISAGDLQASHQLKQAFIRHMRQAPIALTPEKANQQHYEVPADFYNTVLGSLNKYSCCYWKDDTHTLDRAEVNALELSCEHADLQNGQHILELGCGWGSLTLWMARHYPSSQITAVSNSHSQKAYIKQQAEKAGLKNIQIITCDMNDFNSDVQFDRIVSIEMFEHMRNWQQLLHRVSQWLAPGGKFFMHVFSHRSVPYAFEVKDESDWMSDVFFTGGMMPSDDLLLHFQESLQLQQSWLWNGDHYAKTCNAWLANMDQHKASLMPLIRDTYGTEHSQQWWMRWRIFFMACAELFAFEQGQQWHVMHYLMSKPAA